MSIREGAERGNSSVERQASQLETHKRCSYLGLQASVRPPAIAALACKIARARDRLCRRSPSPVGALARPTAARNRHKNYGHHKGLPPRRRQGVRLARRRRVRSGPPAHVAMMLDRLVHGLGWIDEASFTSLFALTQALPGLSSTQLATALGGLRAGVPGAVVAFCCFDAPGFLVMAVAGCSHGALSAIERPEWAERLLASAQIGLAAAAVALVAKAVITLGTKRAPDKLTRVLATGGAVGAMLLPGSGWLFPALLAAGGAVTVAAQAASSRRSAQDSARTALSRAESGVPKARRPPSPSRATSAPRSSRSGSSSSSRSARRRAPAATTARGSSRSQTPSTVPASLIWGGGQARSDPTATMPRRAARAQLASDAAFPSLRRWCCRCSSPKSCQSGRARPPSSKASRSCRRCRVRCSTSRPSSAAERAGRWARSSRWAFALRPRPPL